MLDDPEEGTSQATAFRAPCKAKKKEQKDSDDSRNDQAGQGTSQEDDISLRDIVWLLKPPTDADGTGQGTSHAEDFYKYEAML